MPITNKISTNFKKLPKKKLIELVIEMGHEVFNLGRFLNIITYELREDIRKDALDHAIDWAWRISYLPEGFNNIDKNKLIHGKGWLGRDNMPPLSSGEPWEIK